MLKKVLINNNCSFFPFPFFFPQLELSTSITQELSLAQSTAADEEDNNIGGKDLPFCYACLCSIQCERFQRDYSATWKAFINAVVTVKHDNGNN